MDATTSLFVIVILIMSAVIHEVAHGFAALLMGDKTAKYAGRLTLNPIPHLDPFYSVLLPALLLYMGGFFFAAARPVPFNPYNLKYQKWGPALVALAGPVSNIVIALFFGLFLRFASAGLITLPVAFATIFVWIVYVNVILAVINLIPFPPLDGSKLLFTVLPYRFARFQYMMEANLLLSLGFVFLLILVFGRMIFLLILLLISILTGLSPELIYTLLP